MVGHGDVERFWRGNQGQGGMSFFFWSCGGSGCDGLGNEVGVESLFQCTRAR